MFFRPVLLNLARLTTHISLQKKVIIAAVGLGLLVVAAVGTGLVVGLNKRRGMVLFDSASRLPSSNF